MNIAFKVNVTSIKGLNQGLPALLELFDTYQIKADFMFSFGIEDNQGMIKRLFCRTDKMVQQNKQLFLDVSAKGHYAGIYSYNPKKWQKKINNAKAKWVDQNMEQASAAFMQVFERSPKSHSAANWQIHPEMFIKEAELSMLYASDTRGKYPFYPVYCGKRCNIPQIPVTLSTFDELLAQDQWTVDNLHQALFDEIQYILPYGHVFNLDAEAGIDFIEVLEKVFIVWQGCRAKFIALRDIYQRLDLEQIPYHDVGWGEQEGRAGFVAMQSMKVDIKK